METGNISNITIDTQPYDESASSDTIEFVTWNSEEFHPSQTNRMATEVVLSTDCVRGRNLASFI